MNIIDYDPIAEAFVGYRSAAVTDVVLGLGAVADELRPLDGKCIVDYGCGDGTFCRMLRNFGARPIGVDRSARMIERAMEQDSQGIEYRHIVSGKVPLEGGTADAVTMNFVVSSMHTRDDIHCVLTEAHRLLRPGGTLTILTVNWELANGLEFLTFRLQKFPELISGMKVGGVLKGEKPIEVHDYYWSHDDYRGMLQRAGFVVTKTLEPLATDTTHPWLNEKRTPPFLIFVATKTA